MAEHIVVDSRCPYCDHRFDRATNAVDDENMTPSPGDITICISCASILIFDKRGAAVRPSAAEEREAAADPDVRRARSALLSIDRRDLRNDT